MKIKQFVMAIGSLLLLSGCAVTDEMIERREYREQMNRENAQVPMPIYGDYSEQGQDSEFARLYVDRSSGLTSGNERTKWHSINRVYVDGEDLGKPPIATNIRPGKHTIKIESSTNEGTGTKTYELNAESGESYRY